MSHGERTDGVATARRTRVYEGRSEGRDKREPRKERRRKQKINERRRKRKERVRGRGETREATAKGVHGGGVSPATRRTVLRRDAMRLETSARRVGRETLFLVFYSRAHTRSNLLRVDQKQGRRKRRRKRRAHSPRRSLYRRDARAAHYRQTPLRKGKVRTKIPTKHFFGRA